jgi:hypothetical protein
MIANQCIFRRGTHCINPRVGGAIDDAACNQCAHYVGLPRGLGDIVERVARLSGLAVVAHGVAAATGRPCNCNARRAALNAAIPFADSTKKEP